MPDRCEVLPGDSVVARRGGGLLWVDAPGSPALVAALHACLGVSGPGADRVLSAVAGQVSSLAHGTASFALVLADTSGGAGTGVALWSGKGQPAVDGVPVSGSSVEGCTLASGFPLGPDAVRRARRRPRRRCRRASPTTSSRARCPAPARCCSWPRPRPRRPRPCRRPPRPRRPFGAPSDAGFGSGRRLEPRARAPPAESGEQTAFWRPEQTAAPVLRFDDGMVVTVDEDLVLGRRPDNHELVAERLGPRRCRSPTPRTCSRRRTRRCSGPAARCRWSTWGRSTARTSPGPRPPSGPSSSPASRTRSPTATACSSAGPSSPSSSRSD